VTGVVADAADAATGVGVIGVTGVTEGEGTSEAVGEGSASCVVTMVTCNTGVGGGGVGVGGVRVGTPILMMGAHALSVTTVASATKRTSMAR
jgi:hypothetical protein